MITTTANALTAREISERLFENIVDPLIALMAFIALLVLIIMGIKYIANPDSAGERGGMFEKFGWAIFGIFVIFSIYTIITFVGRLAESPITGEATKGTVKFEEYNLIESGIKIE